MIFDKIRGHRSQLTSLKNWMKSERSNVGRAFVFFGPHGVGKKLVAQALAQGILCREDNRPCGTCASCSKVEKFAHPDLLFIKPEGTTIKIEAISELHRFMAHKSFEGNGKVVIIDDAHLLNQQSSNSLLKVLEEPPEKSFFIFITPNRGALLPTILSRCIQLSFGVLSHDELRELYPDADISSIEKANGSSERLSRFITDESKSFYKEALKLLDDSSKIRNFEAFQRFSEVCPEKDKALKFVSCLMEYVRDALALSLGLKIKATSEEQRVLNKLVNVFNYCQLTRISTRLIRLEQDIFNNVNRSLALEQFWIEFKTEDHINGRAAH